ncbi:hypothetical protein BGZ83_007731 [Gryganskiella cystojenkinii]|nr:hypothetical protein BGZ83_007731 [Gryganskiella cystojenkinii]
MPEVTIVPDDRPLERATHLSTEDKNHDSIMVTSNAVYETAEDDDFISTQDRRRRRRAQKVNSASNSLESLPKSSTIPRETEPKPTHISESTSSSSVFSNSSKDAQPSSPADNLTAEQRATTLQPPAQDQTSHVTLPPKVLKDSKSAMAPSTSGTSKKKAHEVTFAHPIQALNSTSQIVRTKPSHKRSQSAQLPSSSPWSAPPSGTNFVKTASGSTSTLNHVSPSTLIQAQEKSTTSTTSGKDILNATEAKGYNLFGHSSSIWYSPFQSGLDITIESDHEQGKHGSRSLNRPRIQIDNGNKSKGPNRPSLGFLPASSFFESSPRTPRIMPFSQHHTNQNTGYGLEDWSVRTRSSSIAAPLTPLLETDCMDPMDYFGGSRSASSSRRGSVENNLTESLLSGKARMFASSGLDTGSSSPRSIQESSTQSHQQSLSEGRDFLSPSFSTLSLSPPSSEGHSASNLQGIDHSNLITQLPSVSSTFMQQQEEEEDDVAPVFVNPWESNYPYRSTHTMSETFLPFSTSTMLPPVAESSLLSGKPDRQTSLLNLMNGSVGGNGLRSARGSFDTGNNNTSSVIGGPVDHLAPKASEDEKAAIRQGFLFPNLGGLTPLGPIDLPNPTTSTTFRPFASLEMSLAAAANQPPPLFDDPHYDTVELTMKDFATSSSSATRRRGGTKQQHHDGESGSEKKPKERHRRNRSGHHKSASLGSFFPPFPPPSNLAENATPGIQSNPGGTLDPLNRLSSSGSHGPSKLGRHNKDGEAQSFPRRRTTATDQDSHHRSSGGGANSERRHHHRQDSTSGVTRPKKKAAAE